MNVFGSKNLHFTNKGSFGGYSKLIDKEEISKADTEMDIELNLSFF